MTTYAHDTNIVSILGYWYPGYFGSPYRREKHYWNAFYYCFGSLEVQHYLYYWYFWALRLQYCRTSKFSFLKPDPVLLSLVLIIMVFRSLFSTALSPCLPTSLFSLSWTRRIFVLLTSWTLQSVLYCKLLPSTLTPKLCLWATWLKMVLATSRNSPATSYWKCVPNPSCKAKRSTKLLTEFTFLCLNQEITW